MQPYTYSFNQRIFRLWVVFSYTVLEEFEFEDKILCTGDFEFEDKPSTGTLSLKIKFSVLGTLLFYEKISCTGNFDFDGKIPCTENFDFEDKILCTGDFDFLREYLLYWGL